MNSKTILKIAVLIVAVIGILLASIPFFGSLVPSKKASASRPHIDLTTLERGTFLETDSRWSKIFVLHTQSDEIYVFVVPFVNNRYWLPDISWEKMNLPCNSFGPDHENGVLVAGGTFHCRDSEYSDYYEGELRWRLSGESLGVRTQDMQVPEHEIDGMRLYLEEW